MNNEDQRRLRVKELLTNITRNNRLEMRWLRTLSLLEYIGARKIQKSVATHYPRADVLEHLADETRHAASLARLADETNTSNADCAPLAAEAAKHYFQTLDSEVEAQLPKGEGSTELCYLVVTSLIERRAMQIYPLYRSLSRQQRIREELSKIICEEQAHREAIEARCQAALQAEDAGSLDGFWDVEARHFDTLLGALEAACAGDEPASAGQKRREAHSRVGVDLN